MAASPRKVLFLSSSDYGQANVVLATTHAMLHAAPDVEVHIASQGRMEDAVRRIHEPLSPDSPPLKPAHWHLLAGLSQFDAMNREGNPAMTAYDLPPGLLNTCRTLLSFSGLLRPWSPEEFVEIYRDMQRIYDEVKPDVVVVDDLFPVALTWANSANVNWIVLAPNVIKDFAAVVQPNLAVLWKYPVISSAIPYPIPWHLRPLNVIFNLVFAFGIMTNKGKGRLQDHLHKELGPVKLMELSDLGILTPPPEGVRVLVANSPDIDFHFDSIPEYTTACGPIIRAAAPIATVDPEMAAWLRRGPTIYINLGTHIEYDLERAKEMAYALREFLDRAAEAGFVGEDKFQILWKMPRLLEEGDGEDQTKFDGRWMEFTDILLNELIEDRARITHWFTAEPKSILESGHVVCSVHHGGSNSFHEALCAGIPQLTLPAWYDCYDFGWRAELLGIGRLANKKTQAYVNRRELAGYLEEVVIGTKAEEFRQKAKAVSKRHPEREGRENAAKEILALIKDRKTP
ncbi:udp-glucoronosyl and udp-glucosyl transferase family protein [Colletotrichum plurivorum]|uniref:Udp-glucoronosyl and udp-glucosyl transferase family protein n=1 Tax=Colletotrichum plurivorum TaxID=2175906 RepID=A0A8H6NFS8_9PEZI|nr:udp-glucoronosyl and udp-glucosyl transferase family protein [Colletotrichum plurivorum]